VPHSVPNFVDCERNTGVWAVPVDTGAGVSFGEPELLFRGDYDVGRSGLFSVTSDGHFLMVERFQGTLPRFTELKIILNWFEALKERVPTGG